VTFADSAFTATWTDVAGAAKYAVEMTAHYDGYPDETFSFTAPDVNPAVVASTSITVPLSALATVVCNDPPGCTSFTTYDAKSVDVRVKALNPPTPKGKDHAQCNPFAGPVNGEPFVLEIVVRNPPADETFTGMVCFSVIATNPTGTPTILDDGVAKSLGVNPCPPDQYSYSFEHGCGSHTIEIDVTDDHSNATSATVTWFNNCG
jgi:hypothetical protein